MRQRWGRAVVPRPEALCLQVSLACLHRVRAGRSPSVYDFRAGHTRGPACTNARSWVRKMTPGWGWGWGALQGRTIGSHNRPAVASRLVAPLLPLRPSRGRKEQGHPGSQGGTARAGGSLHPGLWVYPHLAHLQGPGPQEGTGSFSGPIPNSKRKGCSLACSGAPGLVRHGK